MDGTPPSEAHVEEVPMNHHRITKLSVTGGYLDGMDLRLEDGLVCFIGPRGSGKTTVLELLRFALGLAPKDEGLCQHFGIEHAKPHRALVDARAALELAKRLLPKLAPSRTKTASTDDRPPRVYVCHPFRDAPDENERLIRTHCRNLVEQGCLPVAPQLYLPSFVDETTERERAMRLCLTMLDDCDEVRVYGTVISEGMRLELEHASERDVPVRFDGGK